ncbi:unknown [Firmicutes bacterium CAG:555]|nr:unknown [Firmicutes bacterium CAG:555]
MLDIATRPKLSLAAFLSLLTEASPTPTAIINGTVMGPVVTPPESNATARNSFGTNSDTRMSTA